MTAHSFEDLTITDDRHPAVHHLDATIDEGPLLAIVSPNGVGKSTVLQAITGPPTARSIWEGCSRAISPREQITQEADAVIGSTFDVDALSSEDGSALTHPDMVRHHVGA